MNHSNSRHPMYFQRLNRDVNDLLLHDFNCSSSCLSVSQDENGIALNVCILEGAYRGGHFSFLLDIPINYPFKEVNVWAKHPIWHPNVELLTGRVFLPLDWSPVLTLNSLALAVQVTD
jgi:ubiquitin-protein ligase